MMMRSPDPDDPVSLLERRFLYVMQCQTPRSLAHRFVGRRVPSVFKFACEGRANKAIREIGGPSGADEDRSHAIRTMLQCRPTTRPAPKSAFTRVFDINSAFTRAFGT